MNEFISNLILKIFPISSMPYWIAFIVIFLIIMAFALIKAIPRIIENNIKQKKEYKSAHQLQIESYFRDISGSKLEDLFSKWTDALISENSFAKFVENPKNVEILMRNTIMYGSNRTISVAALFMQFIYNDKTEESSSKDNCSENSEKAEDYEHNLKGLAYLAELISSLKLDFSGYDISPQLILQIKFEDWEYIKDKMVIYLDEIEKQVDS